MTLTEVHVEEAVQSWFTELDCSMAHGPHLALSEPESELDSFVNLPLLARLRAAIRDLNPIVPGKAREDAFRAWRTIEGGSCEHQDDDHRPHDLRRYQRRHTLVSRHFHRQHNRSS